jgi:SPP1 gp7 family putative phage head morphogenesis protein
MLGFISAPYRSVRARFQQIQQNRALRQKEIAVADTRYRLGSVFKFVAYNPDELAQKKGGLLIYDKMREDEQVKACTAIKKAVMIGPGWKLEPQGDSDAEGALAETLTNDLKSLKGSVEHDMWEALSAIDYGFSVSEMVFDVVERRFRLVALKTRAPHDFEFETDLHGNVHSLRQVTIGVPQQDMPPEKFLHFTNAPEFDNPYGRSDLREAYRSWWHKSNWVQWWALFGERLAVPLVVGKHPKNEGQPTITKTLDRLEKLSASTAMTVPEDWMLELIESRRNPREVFESAVDRHDLGISHALLLPDKSGLAGGEVKAGSFALAKEQFGVWLMVLEQLRQRFSAEFSEQVIRPMAQLEAPTLPPPRLVLLPLAEDDKQVIAEAWISAVTNKAAENEGRDENHLRMLLGFPELDEEKQRERDEEREERKEAAAALPAPAPPGGGGGAEPDEGGGGGRRQPFREDPIPTLGEVERTAWVPATFWRPLVAVERRADMAEKRDTFETGSKQLSDTLAKIMRQVGKDLAQRIERQGLADTKASAVAVRKLAVSQRIIGSAHSLLAKDLQAAYDAGVHDAVREVRRARKDMADALPEEFQAGLTGKAAREFFRNKAFWLTGVLEEDALRKAKRVLFSALRGEKTERQVLFELQNALGDLLPEVDAAGRIVNVPARLRTIARTNVAEAVNEGRWATFTDPKVAALVPAFRYSAILDDRVRANHAAWDGVVMRTNDPRWTQPQDRRPPNGFACRCLLVPVTVADKVELTKRVPRIEVVDPGFG